LAPEKVSASRFHTNVDVTVLAIANPALDLPRRFGLPTLCATVPTL
jgi:hypothetical protein